MSYGAIALGSDTVAENAYDGAKRRVIAKAYTGGVLDETRHLYYTEPSRWQVVEERIDSASDPDRQFVWGLRYVDDLILRDRDTNADATLDERLYGLQDANWNMTAVADSLGVVQERYAYTAYGFASILTPTFTSRATSSFEWESRYAGYRWDETASFFHVRNRAYHAMLGAWMQRDPLGCGDGANLYEYALSNPASFVDPSGELVPVVVGVAACLASPICRCIVGALGFGAVETAVQILAQGRFDANGVVCAALSGCLVGICVGTGQSWECLGLGAAFCLSCRALFGLWGIPCNPEIC